MSETTSEKTQMSAEDLKKAWDALDPTSKKAIEVASEQINAHNENVRKVKAASEGDPARLLAEIREQNPGDDPDLAKFNKRITSMTEQLEKLIAEANEVAKKYLPKELTPEEVDAARTSVQENAVKVRAAANALETLETMLGVELRIHLPEIETLKGVRKSGTKSNATGDTWRPRMSDIFVNGESIKKPVTNTKGEKVMKATMTFLAKELQSRTKSSEFTTEKMQDLYLAAGGGDKEKIPDVVEFDVPYTYKTENQNEETVTFKVKVVK